MKPLSQEPSHTWRSFPYTTNTWTVSSSCRSSSLPQHELMTHQPLIPRESLLTSLRNSPEPGTRLKQSLALTVCCVHYCHPKISCPTNHPNWLELFPHQMSKTFSYKFTKAEILSILSPALYQPNLTCAKSWIWSLICLDLPCKCSSSLFYF